jgi:hypothetical protein
LGEYFPSSNQPFKKNLKKNEMFFSGCLINLDDDEKTAFAPVGLKAERSSGKI